MAAAEAHAVWEVKHVRKLPDAERALELLRELKRRIDPLLSARRFRVKLLYEICCCTSGGRNTAICGFCCPAGDGATSHRIAVRLRRPGSHALMAFEPCMKVLIHELSHIVHPNHSAPFYQLMDELRAQYGTLQARGVVLDAAGFPLGAAGRVLDGARRTPGSLAEGRSKAREAAEARARAERARGGGGGGAVLGGEGGGGGRPDAWRALPPREAAALAAVRRAEDARRGLGDAELEAANEPIELDDDGDVVVDLSDTPPRAPGLGGGGARGAGAGAARAVCAERNGGATRAAGRAGGGACGARDEPAPVPARKRVRGAPPPPGAAAVIDLTVAAHASQPSAAHPPPPPPTLDLVWAARGKGAWQAVGCPVCGPVCMPDKHGAAEMPPQDADEGAEVELVDGGGGGGGTAPPPAPSWACARCTLLNDAPSGRCDACGQSRAQPQ